MKQHREPLEQVLPEATFPSISHEDKNKGKLVCQSFNVKCNVRRFSSYFFPPFFLLFFLLPIFLSGCIANFKRMNSQLDPPRAVCVPVRVCVWVGMRHTSLSTRYSWVAGYREWAVGHSGWPGISAGRCFYTATSYTKHTLQAESSLFA